MDAITDTLALDVATLLTLVGLVAASVRLYLGPSRSDRVVALDLITVLLVAIASLAALRFDDAAYLDLGLTLALVGFLATVAFARYVESEPAGGNPAPDEPGEPDGPEGPDGRRTDPPANAPTLPTANGPVARTTRGNTP